MTPEEISTIAELGEDSRTQFKRNVTNPDQLAQELVAFSNAKGGRLLIGVGDDGTVPGLSAEDIRRLNQMVSNVASQHVVPPICPLTEVVRTASGAVMVVDVSEGNGKPYCTQRGLYLTKVGADKRRVSQEELQRLFQDSSRLFADEVTVSGTSGADVDEGLLVSFLCERYRDRFPDDKERTSLGEILPLLGAANASGTMLRSLGLSDGRELTLAGLLLFGRDPQRFRPVLTVKCVSFFGNELGGSQYRDREEYRGALPCLLKGVLEFLMRNLRKVQSGEGFNAPAELEFPRPALEEAIVNALLHRDYFINAPVRVLLFDDRLEVLSPGRLPNSLTVENIMAGISVSRNPVLHSIGQHLLPYTGLGSGVRRILDHCDADFCSDDEGRLFRVTFPRSGMVMHMSVREPPLPWGASVHKLRGIPIADSSRQGPVTGDLILSVLAREPELTAGQLSQRLGITEAGVRYHLKNLKRSGQLRREGSSRRGRWLIM